MKPAPWLLIFPLLLFFTGCAEKQPPPPPSVPAPTSVEPGVVPPTQRPYRIMGKTYYPLPSAEGYVETGIASWYGTDFHGKPTSNGERYDMHALSAAHKTLPMNTMVLVENLENGRELVLRINDRGPFVKGRIIDLSYRAAQELNVTRNGTAQVRVSALGETTTVTEGARRVERFLPHRNLDEGDFFVQLGAFTIRGNAERLSARLAEQGEEARIVAFDRGDQLFYRVQVAAGNSLENARRREETLTTNGYPDAFVIAR